MSKMYDIRDYKPIKVTCPHCGWTLARPVHPFDYIKQCCSCNRQFSSPPHN